MIVAIMVAFLGEVGKVKGCWGSFSLEVGKGGGFLCSA
jgi:hypothetical protein